MGIGIKLEQLIKKRHRKVSDVSKATGIPATTIYSIINRNSTKIELDVLQTLCNELDVTLDYFVENKNQPHTIAAHHDSNNWTEEELKEIENFKRYVLSKRNDKI